jgi:putative membrane protein
MDRVIQILINAAALYVAVLITPVDFDFATGELWQFLLVAVIFSLINSYLKPILQVLSLPITFATLGIFLLILNALMLMLTGAISSELGLGFVVPDFLAALFAALVITIVGTLLALVIGTGRLAGRAL